MKKMLVFLITAGILIGLVLIPGKKYTADEADPIIHSKVYVADEADPIIHVIRTAA